MTYTVETIQKPSEDECGIVATFSDQSLSQLTSIQDQLIESLGDAIWITPPKALHSTLIEIICDMDYPTSRNELFTTWYKQYNHKVDKKVADLPSFNITFSEIEVSARAVIVKSATSEAFNSIRSEILSKMELPTGTKQPPDITHCTLARFSRILSIEEVTKLTQNIPCDITEMISSLKLMKDLGPPSFEPKTIQVYNLQG